MMMTLLGWSSQVDNFEVMTRSVKKKGYERCVAAVKLGLKFEVDEY